MQTVKLKETPNNIKSVQKSFQNFENAYNKYTKANESNKKSLKESANSAYKIVIKEREKLNSNRKTNELTNKIIARKFERLPNTFNGYIQKLNNLNSIGKK